MSFVSGLDFVNALSTEGHGGSRSADQGEISFISTRTISLKDQLDAASAANDNSSRL